MRITIVQGAFLPVPPLRGGAIEKAWDALGREFAKRGHQVTHVSRLCDGLPATEELRGVRHIRISGYDTPSSMFQTKWCDFLYSRRACAVLPAADILVTNTFWLPLLMRTPAHGRIYVHVGRYPRWQMQFYQHAARLQTVSESVATAITEKAPALAARVKVLPYPLPEGAWSNQALSDESREPIVLFAGRIHPEKGLDLLADAWMKPQTRVALAGWKLILAGPWAIAQGGGGDVFRNRLAAKFATASDTVEWTGPLFGSDTAKLHDLYGRARIFVYPSVADYGETFGLAPLEAMAAGTPCVVSNLACFRDFLHQDENGLIFDHHAPAAEEQLAEALATLAGDAALRTRLGSAAWRTAAHFRVEEVATRYLADFAAILNPVSA